MKIESQSEPIPKTFNYRILSAGLISSIVVIGLSGFAAVFMLLLKFPKLTTDGAMAFARGFSVAAVVFTLLFWIECSIIKPRKFQKIIFFGLFVGLVSAGYWIFPAPFRVVSFLGATAFSCILIGLVILAMSVPLRKITIKPLRTTKRIFIYKLLQFVLIWALLVLQIALW